MAAIELNSNSINKTDKISSSADRKLRSSVTKRVSISGGKDESERPTKRHRRSSIRRKSILETLHCLSESMHEANSSPSTHSTKVLQSSTENETIAETATNTEPPVPQGTNNPSLTINTGQSELIDEVEGSDFVLNWYSTLTDEATSWKNLLKEYKTEEQLKRKSTTDSNDSEGCVPYRDVYMRLGSIDYNKFANKIESLQERFKTAVKTVLHNVDTIHDIYDSQQSLLHSMTDKEKQESFNEFNSTNPMVLIEEIFKCDELLSQTSSPAPHANRIK